FFIGYWILHEAGFLSGLFFCSTSPAGKPSFSATSDVQKIPSNQIATIAAPAILRPQSFLLPVSILFVYFAHSTKGYGYNTDNRR
ncbi:MAG: hypothetical protein V4676_08910, partial [Bacteroidota bacterium]